MIFVQIIILLTMNASNFRNKVEQSSNSFQELIENLKKKNRYTFKEQSSQANPQQCMSEVNKNIRYSDLGSIHLKNQMSQQKPTNNSQWVAKIQDGQDSLKLKPKGNINGRDKVVKKQLCLMRQSMSSNLRNKLSPERTRNSSSFQRNNNSVIVNNMSNTTKQYLSSVSNFNMKLQKGIPFQHKLNQFMAKSKQFGQIDQEKVKQYCLEYQLTLQSEVDEIFTFFSRLCEKLSIFIEDPFIKKYRNCVYFGKAICQTIYHGFLYYFDHKIYYGEFSNGQKSGEGVQINYQYSVIFKGKFEDGKKNGKFNVKKPEEHYIGTVLNGIYQGKGKLTTNKSVYEGFFENGEKHGYGVEIFKNGLKLSGKFVRGYFDTKNQSTPDKSFKINANNQEKFRQTDFNWKKGFNEGLLIGHRLYQDRNKQSSSFPPLQNIQPPLFGQQNPNRIQQFDHSFDTDSRQDTDFSATKKINLGEWRHGGKTRLSMIHQRIQTNQLQDPLPMPNFFQR